MIILLLVLAQPALAAIEAAGGVRLDGDIRERATYVSAIDFDADAPDTGWFWSQRIRLTADLGDAEGLGGRVSLLSAVQSGLETTPIHDNVLDIHEGYLDIPVGFASLRTGRQEIALGSQRLLGVRDGTTVRRNWDGLRAAAVFADWQMDAFGLQLVEVESKGAFNDRRNPERELAGLYASGKIGITGIDLYYLYSGVEDRLTIVGRDDQRRHSLGARAFGEWSNWFWNWEAVYQFGEHGDFDIAAWTLATNTGLRLGAAWSPEVMLSVNIASGDSDAEDDKLETFDALYPRGNYFSDLAQLGPANFVNVNPYLTLRPRQDLSVSLDVNFYWRLEEADGVYGPPGNLIRLPQGSSERFVNTAVSLAVQWQMNHHWVLGVSLAHSRPEAFIRDTGPADRANFAEFTIEARL